MSESTAEKEVMAAHEAYMVAARAGDTAPLAKLFADELQYSHSNAKLETKQEAIDAIKTGKPNFKLHEQKVTVYGNTATVRAKATSINPKTGDLTLSILQVWVKKGGQWQLAQRQTTRLPAP
jgi:ketosteroid isomerase-like protein